VDSLQKYTVRAMMRETSLLLDAAAKTAACEAEDATHYAYDEDTLRRSRESERLWTEAAVAGRTLLALISE